MPHRTKKRASKKKSPARKKRKSGKRKGGHHFTRASALASMNKCPKCEATIFGGPKGLATHTRKRHRGRR